MAKETRQIVGKQYFRATFDKNSIDVQKRTIDVVFVTERQVMMYNWDLGLFYEVLPCNDQIGDLTRLNNGAPLCDTHDTSSVRSGLGVVEKAWFEDGKGRATVRFSKRTDVEPIWTDVQDGIITGVSVGYVVYEYEEVGTKDNLPLIRANKWEGTEISLALVQADIDSGVGRSASDANIKQEITLIRQNSNSNTMTEAEKAALAAERKRSSDILKACRAAALSADFAQDLIDSERSLDDALAEIARKKAPATPAPVPANENEARTQATAAERARASEINKAVRSVKLPQAFADKLIEDGTSLDMARAAIIDEAAKGNTPTPALNTGIQVGVDEKDKKGRAMESALLIRSGLTVEKAGEPGEYRSMTLMDLAKECLSVDGQQHRGLTQMDIAGKALQMGRSAGGQSTADFPIILANVMNKVLRTAYDLQERTFIPWTRKSTATDFKEMLRAQLNDFALEKAQEGGEYKYATLGDTGEKYKVAKYGKIINIDWEVIVNDDMSAFSRIPTLMAGAVAQMQSDVIYGILTGSHLMSDNVQLFDATHGNLAGSGTAIAVASIGAARAAMRKQKTSAGSALNLAPKFLIVGPDNEQLALQYTSQNYVSAKSSDINVWAGTMQPIVESRITGTQWYEAASPNNIDTIEYATIEGQEMYTENKYSFEKDALQFKVRSVFGGKAIDFRGLYKNPGA